MNRGEWVTPNHLFWVEGEVWKSAEQLFRNPVPFRGKVWNLEVETDKDDERNYVLGNGRVAHNARVISC
jgi:hypothetical protein